MVLGDQKDVLANFGHRLKPASDRWLRAVALGRVDIADAIGPGKAQDSIKPDAFPGAEIEHAHLDTRAPQGALGQYSRLRRLGFWFGLAGGLTADTDGRRGGQCASTGSKKAAAINRPGQVLLIVHEGSPLTTG